MEAPTATLVPSPLVHPSRALPPVPLSAFFLLEMSGLGLRLAASTSRTVRVASPSCRIQSRALHQRKELSYPIEEGLGTFLPPAALKMIAVDYQQGLLDRLNDQVRGESRVLCWKVKYAEYRAGTSQVLLSRTRA